MTNDESGILMNGKLLIWLTLLAKQSNATSLEILNIIVFTKFANIKTASAKTGSFMNRSVSH